MGFEDKVTNANRPPCTHVCRCNRQMSEVASFFAARIRYLNWNSGAFCQSQRAPLTVNAVSRARAVHECSLVLQALGSGNSTVVTWALLGGNDGSDSDDSDDSKPPSAPSSPSGSDPDNVFLALKRVSLKYLKMVHTQYKDNPARNRLTYSVLEMWEKMIRNNLYQVMCGGGGGGGGGQTTLTDLLQKALRAVRGS